MDGDLALLVGVSLVASRVASHLSISLSIDGAVGWLVGSSAESLWGSRVSRRSASALGWVVEGQGCRQPQSGGGVEPVA